MFVRLQAIARLGGFELESQVTTKTTHLIAAKPQRTVNMLRGIIHGVWILSVDWIQTSCESGEWVFEEPYELTQFSPAVEVSI